MGETGLECDHIALDERLALDGRRRDVVDPEPNAVAGRVEISVDERLALVLVQVRLVTVLVEEVGT